MSTPLGVPNRASANPCQVENFELAPVASQPKCKNLLVCANIIVQNFDNCQVNYFVPDPKPRQTEPGTQWVQFRVKTKFFNPLRQHYSAKL